MAIEFELGDPEVELTDKRRRPGTCPQRVRWPVLLLDDDGGTELIAEVILPADADPDSYTPIVREQIERELANDGPPRGVLKPAK